MNIKDWFGSLDLAFRYALVFGGLLVLVLILGFIKLLYDKRRLKKFSKLPISSATTSEDREQLAPHEKDEGSLFGIRAIEAGFFGGVVQSRPTSLANTPRESLAELSRVSSPNLRTLRRESSEWSVSAPSSIIDLERMERDRDSISVVSPTYRSTSRLVSMASEPILGQRTSRRNSPSPKGVLLSVESRERLRPSTAQETGRHSHGPSHYILEIDENLLADTINNDAPSAAGVDLVRLPSSPSKHRFKHSETLDSLQMGPVHEHINSETYPSFAIHPSESSLLNLTLRSNTSFKDNSDRASVSSEASSRSSRMIVKRVHSPPPPVPALPPPPVPALPAPVPLSSQETEFPFPRFTNPREPPPLPAPEPLKVPPQLPALPVKAVVGVSTPTFSYFRKPRRREEPPPRQIAHASMPNTATPNAAVTSSGNISTHKSMDVPLPNDDTQSSPSTYSLPELRPPSPLRLSTAFASDSSARSSLDPKVNSNHTSFSFTPTLPEYMRDSHSSEHRKYHRFSNSSPHSSASSSPARKPHTDGYFIVNPAKVSLKRKSNT